MFEDGKFTPQDEPPGGITGAQWIAASTNPVLTHVAHSAGMQIAFHPGGGFGSDAAGDAFVALRRSWNRKPGSQLQTRADPLQCQQPSTTDRAVRHRLHGAATATASTGAPEASR